MQDVDKWCFNVFALNSASGEHALKFIFYELLTRYDLIVRFKVSNNVFFLIQESRLMEEIKDNGHKYKLPMGM